MTSRWWHGLTRYQWTVLAIAWLGWVFDIADTALFNFAKGPMLDELLGAGDAAFAEKSEARMQQLLRRAHAVVVVTHNVDFVRNNCSQAILLEHGEVLYQGAPDTAVLMYQDLLSRRPKRAERAPGQTGA